MNSLQKLRDALKAKGLDAVLVLDELNQKYLTDFAFTDGLLLITMNKAELITDFRYFEMAQRNASKDFNIVMPEDRKTYISKVLFDESVKCIGFEGNSVSFATYHSYQKKFPNVEFVDIGSLIEDIRQIKSSKEIEKMQKAQDITDKAFTHLLSVIKPVTIDRIKKTTCPSHINLL